MCGGIYFECGYCGELYNHSLLCKCHDEEPIRLINPGADI